VEIVHETRGLVGSVSTSQQVTANVTWVNREINKRVDNESSRVIGSNIDSDVVRARVTRGRELGSSTIGNNSKINSAELDKVGGLTSSKRVADETEMTHANGGEDDLLVSVNVRNTHRQTTSNSREVSSPVENCREARVTNGRGTLEIDQEHVVVQESTRDKSISTVGVREKLGSHQTDVHIHREGTEVTGIGKGSLRRVVSPLVYSVSIEGVDGSTESEGGNHIVDGREVGLRVGVEERGRPDKVGDDETVGGRVFSSVGIVTSWNPGSTIGVLARSPSAPRSIAERYTGRIHVGAIRENELVQTTRGVTSIVAHLTDDPTASDRMELVSATAGKVVGRVKDGEVVGVEVEEESIIAISSVDIAERDMNEETQ